ncbi:MAG: hypothetical protein P8099_12240 [Gemmatimonadota bacterium]|jgi:BMFP domain-containing protein YqiC
MTEEKKRPGLGDDVRDGIRAGIGILAAMKDAIEETIQDLVDGGREDSGEPVDDAGAREDAGDEDAVDEDAGEGAATATGAVDAAVNAAKERARAAGRQAAERLDVVTREELEALRAEVAQLRERVHALELEKSSRAASGE